RALGIQTSLLLGVLLRGTRDPPQNPVIGRLLGGLTAKATVFVGLRFDVRGPRHSEARHRLRLASRGRGTMASLSFRLGACALFFAPALALAQDPEICALPDYTTGVFTCDGVDCLPEGTGTRPVLNRLKNRDVLPPDLEIVPFSTKDMVDWHR